ncbi:restriction endonuclease [Roseateles sp. P5_E4]
MPNVRKQERRWKKPRPRVRTANQAFEEIELANAAMTKLFLDEPLSSEELDALLHSDYLSPSSETPFSDKPISLYESAKFEIAVASPFLFSDVEHEVLAYFGRHPELLHSLPPRKFEELVAAVFRQNGFSVELTPETRDGGIDIIAIQKSGLSGSSLHLIECKRYLPHNTVGIGIVQRLLGVVEQHKATKGIVVTTSSFTRDAVLVAESAQHRLVLNEYSKLASWLAEFAKPNL